MKRQRRGPRDSLIESGAPMDYDFFLLGPLCLAGCAAAILFVLAFTPRFSITVFGNALLLATVLLPLATNRLDVGTQVGVWLWLANCFLLVMLLVRWANQPQLRKAVLASSVGVVAFGLHILFFASMP